MVNLLGKAMGGRSRPAVAGAALLLLGAAGGAGAVSLTRPGVEMAPTVTTAIARLANSEGVVTVRGRVAEVFGNSFVVQDATGRALVATGREGADMTAGSPVMVQGRFDDGQLRARFLVDGSGQVREVGPGRPPHGGPGAPPPPPRAPAAGEPVPPPNPCGVAPPSPDRR